METEKLVQAIKHHDEFSVHMLNNDGKVKAQLIKQGFDRLLTDLENICVEGRSLSLAKTKLEEACFFAKKAMALNLANQEV